MTEKQIQTFKKYAKQYRFYLKLMQHIEERIDVVFYQMTGVKAVSMDSVRIKPSPEEMSDKYYRLSEIYDSLLKSYDIVSRKKLFVDEVISKMNDDDKEIFRLRYHDGLSLERISKMCFLSKSGLHYRIEKALEELEI